MRENLKGLLPRTWAESNEQRVHMDTAEADVLLARAIYRYGSPRVGNVDEVVLLCIGTDRSIGDAFGPLVGSELQSAGVSGCTILGTLDNPVHASNLVETINWVHASFRNPFVIAVDACLGRVESVGVITAGKGSLKPGAGVNKSLPAVGEIYVTGVVNVGGCMEYFVLANTRLSLVMRMARVAVQGISKGIEGLNLARQSSIGGDVEVEG